MNTIIRKEYTAPKVELISLDSDISLSLESGPPIGPDETTNGITPEYFNTNIFKTDLV